MKECTTHLRQLSAYSGGQLAPQDALVLENHLFQCADCSAEWDREQELRQRLASMPSAECPEHLVAAIMAATEQDTVLPDSQPSRWWSWSAVAVAAVLAVLFLPGLTGVLVSDAPAPQVAEAQEFSAEEVARAKHDVIATLTLAADVFARSGENTMSDIFGNRLPQSLSGSLKTQREPQRTDAQSELEDNNHNVSPLGGNG